MIKIGDTLYQFDINHRVYEKDADGRGRGSPIYEKHFRPFPVIGETKQSWLCGHERMPMKVNKATLRESGKSGYSGHQWFTAEGMEDDIWLHSRRHEIVRLLERCQDVNILKKIDALLATENSAS